jgi:hypothetical protein
MLGEIGTGCGPPPYVMAFVPPAQLLQLCGGMSEAVGEEEFWSGYCEPLRFDLRLRDPAKSLEVRARPHLSGDAHWQGTVQAEVKSSG